MTTTVKALLHEIEALPEKERLELDRALDQRLEEEFLVESRKAARLAKKRKIGMADIDRAIALRRYGK
jgi:hypothetical protein